MQLPWNWYRLTLYPLETWRIIGFYLFFAHRVCSECGCWRALRKCFTETRKSNYVFSSEKTLSLNTVFLKQSGVLASFYRNPCGSLSEIIDIKSQMTVWRQKLSVLYFVELMRNLIVETREEILHYRVKILFKLGLYNQLLWQPNNTQMNLMTVKHSNVITWTLWT